MEEVRRGSRRRGEAPGHAAPRRALAWPPGREAPSEGHAEAARALDARARRCEDGVTRIGEEFNRVQQEHRLWMGSDKDAIGNLLRSITSAERVAAILLRGGAAGDECPETAAGLQGAAVADDQLWAEQQASMAIDCEKALPCQPPAARCPLPLPDLPAACRRQDGAAADGRAAHSPPRTGALLAGRADTGDATRSLVPASLSAPSPARTSRAMRRQRGGTTGTENAAGKRRSRAGLRR